MAQESTSETALQTPDTEVLADAAETGLSGESMTPHGERANRRRSTLPLLVGWVLAAAFGSGATLGALRYYPQLLPIASDPEAQQQIAQQAQDIAGLSSKVKQLSRQSADPATLQAMIAENVKTQLAELPAPSVASPTDLASLTKRVAALESVPAPQNAQNDQSAAQNAAAAQDARDAEAKAAQARAEADKIALDAQIKADIAEIGAALESGAAFDAPLQRLKDAGQQVPDALLTQSQGVPTLMFLRNAFPAAARDALALSLAASTEDSTWGRVVAFLRGQTGARSLTPRAGTDPDAVLSRAEAALNANDLQTALSELGGLPEAGKARMAEWVGLAGNRAAALSALATLMGGANP